MIFFIIVALVTTITSIILLFKDCKNEELISDLRSKLRNRLLNNVDLSKAIKEKNQAFEALALEKAIVANLIEEKENLENKLKLECSKNIKLSDELNLMNKTSDGLADELNKVSLESLKKSKELDQLRNINVVGDVLQPEPVGLITITNTTGAVEPKIIVTNPLVESWNYDEAPKELKKVITSKHFNDAIGGKPGYLLRFSPDFLQRYPNFKTYLEDPCETVTKKRKDGSIVVAGKSE
jgi:hypothetical protein